MEPIYILDVEPIQKECLNSDIILNPENVIERPCLNACKILWSKGIKTWTSSANRQNVKRAYSLFHPIDMEFFKQNPIAAVKNYYQTNVGEGALKILGFEPLNKNILNLESDFKYISMNGYALIGLDRPLSPANAIILQKLASQKESGVVSTSLENNAYYFYHPLSKQTTIKEVNDVFCKIANQLEDQNAIIQENSSLENINNT